MSTATIAFVTLCNSVAIISTATLVWKHRKDGHGG